MTQEFIVILKAEHYFFVKLFNVAMFLYAVGYRLLEYVI